MARLPPALAPPTWMLVRVDAEVGGRGTQPARRCDAVVERHRVVHAADGEAVVDAHHDRPGASADLARGEVGLGHVQVAEHEGAAVQPEQGRAVGSAASAGS